jgi:uncharacterized peroxidase-related enzyme
MSRIKVVDHKNANADQKALLKAIESQLGMVPNFLRVMANSTAALRAFMGLHEITAEGSLNPQTRERIALALAQQNSCEYFLAAHTAIGRKAGLDSAEMATNRRGTSQDSRAAVAVEFARVVAGRGEVTDAQILKVRDAGYSESDIVEILTHVGMNTLTNLVGNASRAEVDFPRVELKLAS